MVKLLNCEIKSSQDNILQKAHKMGIVAKLYPQNTISALTDLLGNVWMGDQKKKLGGFQSIDSTYFELIILAH